MPDYLIRLPDGTEKLIRSEKPLTSEQLAAIARQLYDPPGAETFDPAGMQEQQPAALPQQQGTPVTPARQITLWDYAPKELKKRVADLEARAQKTGGAAGAAFMAEAQRTKESWTIANFQQYYRSRIADLQAQIRAQAKRAEELEKRAKEEGGVVGANLMVEAKRVRDDIVKRIRPRIAQLAEELRQLPRQDIRLGFKEDRQAQREEARISAEALKEGYKIIDPTRGQGPFTPKPTEEDIRRAKEHNRRIDELSAEAERASREIISELQVRAPISYLFSGDIQSFGLTGGAAISDAIGSAVQDPVGFVKEVAAQMGVSLARLVVKVAQFAGAGPPDRHQLAAVGLGDDVADARFGEDLIEDAFDVLNLLDVAVIAKAGSLAAKATKARIGDIVAKKAAARAEATAKALGLEDAAVDAAKASAAKAAKDEFIELIDKAEDSPLAQAGRETTERAKAAETPEQAPRATVEEPSGKTPTPETPTGAKAAETGAQGQEPVIPKEPEAPVQQETPKASVEETLEEAKKALGEDGSAGSSARSRVDELFADDAPGMKTYKLTGESVSHRAKEDIKRGLLPVHWAERELVEAGATPDVARKVVEDLAETSHAAHHVGFGSADDLPIVDFVDMKEAARNAGVEWSLDDFVARAEQGLQSAREAAATMYAYRAKQFARARARANEAVNRVNEAIQDHGLRMELKSDGSAVVYDSNGRRVTSAHDPDPLKSVVKAARKLGVKRASVGRKAVEAATAKPKPVEAPAPEPEPLPQPKATPKPVETPAPEVPETPRPFCRHFVSTQSRD